MTAKNNIFAIDVEAVIAAISEANAALTRRQKDLMSALERFPRTLATDEDIDRAKIFASTLRKHAARCRDARLEDTKPLRKLIMQVERFFKAMEAEISHAEDTVVAALSDVGRRQAERNRPQDEKNRERMTFMVNSATGDVLGSASGTAPEVAVPAATVAMTLEVEAVDRETVDLEALRPYLSERVILSAARKHLETRGPHTLCGVIYRQVAKI